MAFCGGGEERHDWFLLHAVFVVVEEVIYSTPLRSYSRVRGYILKMSRMLHGHKRTFQIKFFSQIVQYLQSTRFSDFEHTGGHSDKTSLRRRQPVKRETQLFKRGGEDVHDIGFIGNRPQGRQQRLNKVRRYENSYRNGSLSAGMEMLRATWSLLRSMYGPGTDPICVEVGRRG